MKGELHVLFKVGDMDYVVSAADVLHMESFVGATKVPGTQPHVVGVMQIRQRVVPILDLRTRFGLPPSESQADARVIVVSWTQRAIGLLVDSAREVIELSADAFSAPPQAVTHRAQGFVTALAQAGTRMVMRVDLGKIIGEEELHGE